MKNNQLSMLLQGALALQDIKGFKFAYALKRNIAFMKSEIKRIYEIVEPRKDFLEYDSERIKLAEEFSEKDKDGKPVIIHEKDGNDNYKIKGRKKFDAALKKLKEKHSDAVKGYDEQLDMFREKLEEECIIKWFKIKEMPEDVSARQMDIIYSFMMDKPESEMTDEEKESAKKEKNTKTNS